MHLIYSFFSLSNLYLHSRLVWPSAKNLILLPLFPFQVASISLHFHLLLAILLSKSASDLHFPFTIFLILRHVELGHQVIHGYVCDAILEMFITLVFHVPIHSISRCMFGIKFMVIDSWAHWRSLVVWMKFEISLVWLLRYWIAYYEIFLASILRFYLHLQWTSH